MKKLPARTLLDAAKLFSYNGDLCLKRLSPTRFIFPLFQSQHYFKLYSDGFDLLLYPMSLTLVSAKPLVSVRDLLNPSCDLSKVFFSCYCDPDIDTSNLRLQARVDLQFKSNLYSLNCKVYKTKYDSFYSELLPGVERRHVTLRVTDVSVLATHKHKSS